VKGTIPPPDILSVEPHGGDTRMSVEAPRNAPLIVSRRPGHTARFEGRARIADLKEGAWQTHRQGSQGGWIYKVALKRPIWQLWLDDSSLTVARYPNVGSDWFEDWPQTYPLSLTSARGSAGAGSWSINQGQHPPKNSSYDDYVEFRDGGYWGGWFTTDGGNANQAVEGNRQKNAEWNQNAETGRLRDSKLDGFDFDGGIIHARMCWKTEFWHPLPITAHSGRRIDFDASIQGKVFKGPDTCTKGYNKPEKFYIEALDALDMPKEWWYDRRTQKLYVYMPDGGNPSNANLMGKVNDLALDFHDSKNVHLEELEFFGTFASAGDQGGGAMARNTFLFPNYPRHILRSNILTENQLRVTNQDFIDNEVRYFCFGTVFRGPSVHVENNLYEHGIYGCGPMGCGVVFVQDDAVNPVVERTTIRYTQQWHGIVWLAEGFEGKYNHLHDVCTVRDDASNFQTKYRGEYKSHIHHNWVYNSELKGARYDTCGGKATTGSGYPECGGAIWNNVFFNLHQGANVKGDYQHVVGNTGFANGQRVDLTLSAAGVGGTEDDYVYNRFSEAHNNAAPILSKSDQRCVLPLPGNETVEDNYPGRCSDFTPLKQLLRDPFNFDFRPRGDGAQYPDGILNGATTNLRFWPATGGRITLSQGRDVGAYQRNNGGVYWIPGRQFSTASTPVPPHTTVTARADADLMFNQARSASTHKVYLSTDPCRAQNAGEGDAELVATLRNQANIVQNSALGGLQSGRWYYWRVDHVGGGETRRGPVWCFAVGPGEGGCERPPCGDWQSGGAPGQRCATDGNRLQPIVPTSCGASPTTAPTPGATPAPTPVVEPEPTATPAPPEECKNAAGWRKCNKDWVLCSTDWAKENCRKKCGLCDDDGDAPAPPTTPAPTTPAPTTPAPAPPAECEDVLSQKKCNKILKRGNCDTDYGRNNCKKTCGLCGDEEDPDCQDKAKEWKCQREKDNGNCGSDWAQKKCKKTCEHC